MNNIIEETVNEENISETFLLRNIETSGRSLVETLEKNIGVLRTEASQVANISSQLETKLRYYNELSQSLTCKLQSLVALSELGCGDRRVIKDFVEQITLSWLHANKELVKEYAGIRVASRTTSGAPLTSIMNKIKKEAAAVKVSLQIGSVIYDQDYVSRGYRIYEQISLILESLERCDDKVQQYLVICRTTPYLIELSGTIDEFVANTDFLPRTEQHHATKDFVAFRYLAKLLTGELFGQEATNPWQILADNAPRKPVFITLNNKRKLDIPRISENKIQRNLSSPSKVKCK